MDKEEKPRQKIENTGGSGSLRSAVNPDTRAEARNSAKILYLDKTAIFEASNQLPGFR